MSAYIVVAVTIKDQEKQQVYASLVPETLKLYAGELVVVGLAEVLHGDFKHQAQVILKFPSKEDALNWYNSPEYQALIPNRNEALDTQFQLVSE